MRDRVLNNGQDTQADEDGEGQPERDARQMTMLISEPKETSLGYESERAVVLCVWLM